MCDFLAWWRQSGCGCFYAGLGCLLSKRLIPNAGRRNWIESVLKTSSNSFDQLITSLNKTQFGPSEADGANHADVKRKPPGLADLDRQLASCVSQS